jgi:RNA polymerase sigma-70 factor (ECF subfamily)
MSEDPTDLETRVRGGSVTALALYVDRHRARLLARIDGRLGADLRRRIDPEDVLQETLVAAFRRLNSAGLGDRDPFAWLCMIAEERVIDLARQHRADCRSVSREVSTEAPVTAGEQGEAALGELLAASLTSPSAAVARDEREAQLRAFVAELPEETRTILHLRFADGLATKEIADRLQRSDDAVRAVLSRTLRQLQARLEAAGV